MRILWVKAGGLVPPDTGGKIRSYNILKELVKRHEVTLFTFYRKHDGDQHRELAQTFHRVVCVPLRIPQSRTISEIAFYFRNALSRRPYAIAKFCQPQAAAALRDLLRDVAFDVVICDFANAGGVIPWELPVPKILFTHNVEAQIWLRHYQNARNPFWKAVAWREYRRMRRAEESYLKSADHVLTVSDVDQQHFSRFVDSSRIEVISTGVDVEFFRPDASELAGNVLVFTGSMDWLPNEDGILYFVRDVLPRIRQQVPDAQLRIVGRLPSARIRSLAEQDPGIQVTGRVDDIRPHVRDAKVYVVPLRIGGGTRLKIFEAMAMGKAVVSTAIGAEGLPVEHGKNILLSDQAEEFADNVVGLLRDPIWRQQLGRTARLLVEKQYSWKSVTADFEKVLIKVANSNEDRLVACGTR